MSYFVYDMADLPTGKSDAKPLMVAANLAVVAAEWNTVIQVILDARGALTTYQLVSSPEITAFQQILCTL